MSDFEMSDSEKNTIHHFFANVTKSLVWSVTFSAKARMSFVFTIVCFWIILIDQGFVTCDDLRNTFQCPVFKSLTKINDSHKINVYIYTSLFFSFG